MNFISCYINPVSYTHLDVYKRQVIRRRYANGIKNLTTLYTPICDYWTIYDNSAADGIHKIAWGVKDEIKEIIDPLSYQKIVDYERG